MPRPLLFLRLALLLALCFVLCLAAPTVRAQQYLPVTDLGILSGDAGSIGYAVNNSGQVAGNSYPSDAGFGNYGKAVLYTGGMLFDLNTLVSTSHLPLVTGYSINNVGQVAGAAADATGSLRPFLYTPGAGLQDLNFLSGGYGYVTGVNERGVVTGVSSTASRISSSYYGAFVYDGMTVSELGTLGGDTSTGMALNGIGQVAGHSNTNHYSSSEDGFFYNGQSVYSSKSMVDLGTPPGGGSQTTPQAINDAAQIVGSLVVTVNGSTRFHAFSWSGGVMTDLDVLSLINSNAYGINSGGQIVGGDDAGACLWQNGAKTNLNTLIDPASGWVLTTARAISNTGYITGSGTHNGQKRAFLMQVPVLLAPAAISFTPNPVHNGQTTQGTVTLTGPAPAGGAAVAVSVGGESATTVTVPQGQTTAPFGVPTLIAQANQTEPVTAFYNGGTVATTISINVIPVSLSFSPGTMLSGQSTTGTLTLSGPAPYGAFLALTINGISAASVSLSSTTTTFPLTVPASYAGQTVTIAGTYNGVTVSTPVTVTAPPPVYPNSLTFYYSPALPGQTNNAYAGLTGPAPYGGAVITFTLNGTSYATETVAAGEYSATLPFTLSSSYAGQTVTLAAYYNGITVSSNLSVNPAPPVLSSISPNSATVGDPALTMTVTGSSFVSSSVVRWGGANLATTYVSPTQLTATVSASLLTGGGYNYVQVVDAIPNGGSSSSLPFTVNNLVPTIASLNPATAGAGSAALTLTLNGSGFASYGYGGGITRYSASTVYWNGQYLSATYISPTQLTVSVPASYLKSVGTASVTVANASPGGGTSNALPFTITAPDTIAPTTTASLSGGRVGNIWFVTAVQVTLSAADNTGGSGVASTFYTVDGGTPQTYSAPFTITGDGSHSLMFWSVDKAGNMETAKMQSIPIDATPPTLAFGTPTPAPNAAGWNHTAVDVPYTTSDATSGVVYSSLSNPVHFGAEGVGQTQNIFALDAAYNEIDCTTPAVSIDLTAPATTATVNGTTVTLAASDALSGVVNTYYTVDNGAQTTYAAPFAVMGDGTHTVTFWSVDVAGNTEAAKTQSVTVDATAPTTTASQSGTAGTNGWYTSGVQVTLSATDNTGGTGVANTFYTLDGGVQTTYRSPFTVSSDGTHTLTFYSVDNAGNTESVNASTIKIDTTPPITTASISATMVILTATDTLSGVAGTTYAIDAGPQTAYIGPFAVTGAGTHTVSFSSTDIAGNAEMTHSVTVTIAAPITVVSLSLSPAGVKGGAATSTGTLTLSGPAPVGGLAVKQTSSDTSAATLAPTLNIPVGATSAKFKITTYAVTGTKSVTITSAANGSSQTAVLTVTGTAPVTVTALSVSPTSVVGGAVSMGTLTLSSAAPSGGTVVTLSSSDTASATVPSSVTVTAGQMTGTFSVTSKMVTSLKMATVTATLGSSSQGATLTVTPAVAGITVVSLSVSPTSVKGGSATSTGTVTLSGPAPAGGLAIKQTSSDTSSATVAGTLNIPAGVTSAKFKITTYVVSSTKSVTITSFANGASKMATLTVTH